MEYKKKETKSESLTVRVKPSTYNKLQKLMDAMFMRNTSEFVEFVAEHLHIPNKKVLKEYLDTIKELEKKKKHLQANLEFRLKPKGDDD